jgi:hypothetical protein
MNNGKFYKNGLKFECTGCGQCCKIADGYVRIHSSELMEISNFLDIPEEEFVQRYVLSGENDQYDLKSHEDGSCIFLEQNRCMIYDVRPEQCRTFPFWNENLKSAYRWKSLKEFCEGIDRGPVYSFQQIQQVLKEKVAINSVGEGVTNEKNTLVDL